MVEGDNTPNQSEEDETIHQAKVLAKVVEKWKATSKKSPNSPPLSHHAKGDGAEREDKGEKGVVEEEQKQKVRAVVAKWRENSKRNKETTASKKYAFSHSPLIFSLLI